MIVRIQASGGSFLGAGKYYLHDKSDDAGLDKSLKPSTDERVWFTDTRNTLNTDAERALDEMWRTADDQAFLKMQAGVKRGGRVCENPVKTLSLSWHKDDQPTPEHMIASADAFMKHMGWDQHQAVYIGHNDTEHRHIHIVLNRVHPETGRTIDDYRERKRAQEWALGYEKEQENIRCAEREVRAAEREGRAPEMDAGKVAEQHHSKSAEQHRQAEIAIPTPANDHLPHNVIMLSREHEQAFKGREGEREAADRDQRGELKAEQRAEREAFFKDGGKLFKATRHAVYDEVRKEFAPEWRQFYKDAETATREAELASRSAITRAMYFAGRGEWEEAREAFSNRDSVRDAVAAELAERKADLKDRQTADLRERQRDACDALREVRDVQYQDMLQRQRDERAAFKASETLEAIGAGHNQTDAGKVAAQIEPAANENRVAEVTPVQRQNSEPGIETPLPERKLEPQAPNEVAMTVAPGIEQLVRAEDGGHIDLPHVQLSEQEAAPARGPSDLAAGAIGSVASYLADQLGELFSP
ncbi:MAG: relaxase/mobilization nuclease domain-containing protein, partial [Hyphomicrobiaceae bacterium]|nr:relaxase/mobilization nuclease domain-containing protein [Hyphomicrobiaceae bacterium]